MHRMLIALVLSIPLALGLSIRPAGATHDWVGGHYDYAPFVGRWIHHGFSLEVTAGGTAFAVYRLYTNCGARQRAGCDRLIGNQIYAGGLWAASLRAPTGTRVSGVIGASADTSLDGTSIRLVRAPHDLLLLTGGVAGQRTQTTLCGPQALSSTNLCGA